MTKGQTTVAPAAIDEAGLIDRQVYSITEASKLLGLGRSSAYSMAAAGELPGVKRLGRRFVVLRSVLDAWLRGEAA